MHTNTTTSIIMLLLLAVLLQLPAVSAQSEPVVFNTPTHLVAVYFTPVSNPQCTQDLGGWTLVGATYTNASFISPPTSIQISPGGSSYIAARFNATYDVVEVVLSMRITITAVSGVAFRVQLYRNGTLIAQATPSQTYYESVWYTFHIPISGLADEIRIYNNFPDVSIRVDDVYVVVRPFVKANFFREDGSAATASVTLQLNGSSYTSSDRSGVLVACPPSSTVSILLNASSTSPVSHYRLVNLTYYVNSTVNVGFLASSGTTLTSQLALNHLSGSSRARITLGGYIVLDWEARNQTLTYVFNSTSQYTFEQVGASSFTRTPTTPLRLVLAGGAQAWSGTLVTDLQPFLNWSHAIVFGSISPYTVNVTFMVEENLSQTAPSTVLVTYADGSSTLHGSPPGSFRLWTSKPPSSLNATLGSQWRYVELQPYFNSTVNIGFTSSASLVPVSFTVANRHASSDRLILTRNNLVVYDASLPPGKTGFTLTLAANASYTLSKPRTGSTRQYSFTSPSNVLVYSYSGPGATWTRNCTAIIENGALRLTSSHLLSVLDHSNQLDEFVVVNFTFECSPTTPTAPSRLLVTTPLQRAIVNGTQEITLVADRAVNEAVKLLTAEASVGTISYQRSLVVDSPFITFFLLNSTDTLTSQRITVSDYTNEFARGYVVILKYIPELACYARIIDEPLPQTWVYVNYLVYAHRYRLQILDSSRAKVYEVGDFVATGEPLSVLISYVKVAPDPISLYGVIDYDVKSYNGRVLFTYCDSTNKTRSITVTVTYKKNNQIVEVYRSTFTSQSFVTVDVQAPREARFVTVQALVDHEKYGQLTLSKPIAVSTQPLSLGVPPDFLGLNSILPWLTWEHVISIFVIVTAMTVVGVKDSAWLGILGALLALFFTFIGWLQASWLVVVLCLVIAVIDYLAGGRER